MFVFSKEFENIHGRKLNSDEINELDNLIKDYAASRLKKILGMINIEGSINIKEFSKPIIKYHVDNGKKINLERLSKLTKDDPALFLGIAIGIILQDFTNLFKIEFYRDITQEELNEFLELLNNEIPKLEKKFL